jgi:Ca2+-binding RTX toxin-like protein
LRITHTGTDGDATRDAVGTSLAYSSAASEYLVAWQADGLPSDDETEVFGQRLSVAGAAVDSPLRISQVGRDGDASRDAGFSALAYNSSSDEYLAAWQGDGLATDDEVEVFGRRLAIVPSTETPTPEGAPRAVTCRGLRPTILGTPAAEPLRGTKARDVIVAGAGDDIILGRGGDDLICAGKGSDDLRGDAGEDTILGRDGSDDLRGGGGNDILQGGEGGDVLFGGSGTDVLVGTGSRDAPIPRWSRDACRGGSGGDLIFACDAP